jgi:hypothetical protein
MSEIVLSKRSSFLIAAACLALGVYCVQFALIPQTLAFVWVYGLSLLLFIAMTLANFQGVRFTGLNVMPPNKVLIVLFWGALTTLIFLDAMSASKDVQVAKSRPAHFFVGLGLLVFFGLSFFGSFFSGFGMYLFLRNPISWARDIKSRGKSPGAP